MDEHAETVVLEPLHALVSIVDDLIGWSGSRCHGFKPPILGIVEFDFNKNVLV